MVIFWRICKIIIQLFYEIEDNLLGSAALNLASLNQHSHPFRFFCLFVYSSFCRSFECLIYILLKWCGWAYQFRNMRTYWVFNRPTSYNYMYYKCLLPFERFFTTHVSISIFLFGFVLVLFCLSHMTSLGYLKCFLLSYLFSHPLSLRYPVH